MIINCIRSKIAENEGNFGGFMTVDILRTICCAFVKMVWLKVLMFQVCVFGNLKQKSSSCYTNVMKCNLKQHAKSLFYETDSLSCYFIDSCICGWK